METTTIFSPSPVFNPKPLFSKPLYPSSLAPKRTPHFSPCKATLTSNGKQLLPTLQLPQLNPKSWFSNLNHGLAAFALSMAISFCPGLPSDTALASEFDVINDGPPTESYVVDDAGVLSRVTKSDLKRLLSDLESRKNFRINFITVRKLTSKADAFEYADQVLEKWYPTIEEGNNKGLVVLITSQKEGAVTGGPKFIEAVGESVLDATVSENLPGKSSGTCTA